MNDHPPTIAFTKLISASLLRMRMKSPFFGTLAMFVRFIPSANISAAATDGRDIFFNPEFLTLLPSQQQDGILLHEILHTALLHPSRLRERDPHLWNIAADLVVNGMILCQDGFELPPGCLRDQQLEHLSVEEVYESLQAAGTDHFQLENPDLLTPNVGDVIRCTETGECDTPQQRFQQRQSQDANSTLAAYWAQALQRATTVATTNQSGKVPLGLDRELEAIEHHQVDWRSYLWQYLVQTPTDFQGFDRRFVGRGLYLESLQGESVRVYVAIDTSGSICEKTLGLFLSEVNGILNAYPHLTGDLYYVDCDVYGPHLLTVDSILPTPQGGGGSSFVSFFDRVAESCDEHRQAICIYLTDGYGEFPLVAPELPTLWVVTPGGLDLAQFPFGETVRLVENRVS
jgi:predicted metal-dependent peptidase